MYGVVHRLLMKKNIYFYPNPNPNRLPARLDMSNFETRNFYGGTFTNWDLSQNFSRAKTS